MSDAICISWAVHLRPGCGLGVPALALYLFEFAVALALSLSRTFAADFRHVAFRLGFVFACGLVGIALHRDTACRIVKHLSGPLLPCIAE